MTTEMTITLDMRLLRAVFHHSSTDIARPGMCGVQVLANDISAGGGPAGDVVAYLATDTYTLATAAPAAYVNTWREQMTTLLPTEQLVLIPSAVIKAAKALGPGMAVLSFVPQREGSDIGTWTWREIGGKGAGASVVDAIGYAFPTVGGLLSAEFVPFEGQIIALNGDYLSRWADSATEMVRHQPAKRRTTAPVRLIGEQGRPAYGKAPIRVELVSEIGTVIGLHMPVRVSDGGKGQS